MHRGCSLGKALLIRIEPICSHLAGAGEELTVTAFGRLQLERGARSRGTPKRGARPALYARLDY
jgi:hypothetical protein